VFRRNPRSWGTNQSNPLMRMSWPSNHWRLASVRAGQMVRMWDDHFVVVVLPPLVQFDRRPLGGANFQYYHCTITQPYNLATQQNINARPCNTTITQPLTQQSRNLATQQSRNLAIRQSRNLVTNNNATLQGNNHANLQGNNHATLQHNNHATLQLGRAWTCMGVLGRA
jgi:hypothetical protein